MSQYVWSEVRAKAVQLFNGERPRAETEQAIIDAFEREPRRVTEAVDHIGHEVERGKVRSGWEVLRVHLTRSDENVRELVVSDESEQARLIVVAETRVRNVCCHYDRPSEVESELFGERGLLTPGRVMPPCGSGCSGSGASSVPAGSELRPSRKSGCRSTDGCGGWRPNVRPSPDARPSRERLDGWAVDTSRRRVGGRVGRVALAGAVRACLQRASSAAPSSARRCARCSPMGPAFWALRGRAWFTVADDGGDAPGFERGRPPGRFGAER
jgi:hypothetical protein